MYRTLACVVTTVSQAAAGCSVAAKRIRQTALNSPVTAASLRETYSRPLWHRPCTRRLCGPAPAPTSIAPVLDAARTILTLTAKAQRD